MPAVNHFSLQKALYETLTGDVTLMDLITDIYDRVPDAADFPYVTVGSLRARDWSSKTHTGMEYTVQINVWSREGGRKESADIMGRIYTLLHDQPLTVEGQTLISIRFVSSDILLEKDGWSYHGILQFTALLQDS